MLKGRSILASPPKRGADLAVVPTGRAVAIDANIFIYHFTQSPLTAACTAFLHRVEAGELRGYTAVATLAEVAHRLMLLEAIRTLGLTPRTAVRSLKEHPMLVTRLTEYRQALAAIPGFGVTVVPVTPAHLAAAQDLCAREGLLTNDALLVAVTQALGLTDLASNDPDLARLPGLTLWQPQVTPGAAERPTSAQDG